MNVYLLVVKFVLILNLLKQMLNPYTEGTGHVLLQVEKRIGDPCMLTSLGDLNNSIGPREAAKNVYYT